VVSEQGANPIISVRGLSREFDGLRAVDGMDLEISKGELFGLIGPDGAGKTTTLRLLAGLLKVTSGEARVAGFDLVSNPEAIKPHIGYMAQEFSLYAELTVTENLHFFSDIYGVDPRKVQERSERLLAFAGLQEFKQRWAEHLSGGMKKKLALACTLIHEPEILLLDEPTTGVDPVSRREFWEILTDLNLSGTTIVVTTPYMDEADRCERVGLMYAGRLVICESPAAIRAELPGEVIELQPGDWRKARNVVRDLPGVLQVQTYGESLHLIVDSAEQRTGEIMTTMKEKGLEVRKIKRVAPRMEEAFISLIHQIESGEQV
jgi:ABC-2 type transport system ATP-binding protein